MSNDLTEQTPWQALRAFTEARIALGRAGTSLPTREVLKFNQAHAAARDAVWTEADFAPLHSQWPDALEIRSQASNRAEYLRRPDLGRALHPHSKAVLQALGPPTPEVLIVVGDGLSAAALEHAPALLSALLPLLGGLPTRLLLAHQCRVALADEAGELLGSGCSLMILGERPGLSSADSLGAYLTFAPRLGRQDSERNCVSNIRPGGLSMGAAAHKIAFLLRESLRRQLSGVQLKDETGRDELCKDESAKVISNESPL
ncbi:ethanolamine ammonia-lyase subunit EutC [Deinococcus psychrotolerans]|uniref:Ethanolamine ammonia-lyase small subunit n=1 Tax=Deinococcus psychrotolerans TaxID=2489213 RepID=A0A3G8YAH9_9DEIO|nr:ethanolamine ammonia-lyase subunit EutC [Deinococcus psychrotolerans]AZI42379.1 ethanolamine ammonia-lyase subunit EutC [Deinococcus psychrotolerans]